MALLLLLLLLLLVLLEYGDFRHVPQGDKVVREREERVGGCACVRLCMANMNMRLEVFPSFPPLRRPEFGT